MHETATKLLESKFPTFLKACGGEILDAVEYRGDLTVVVAPKGIRSVIKFLKEDPSTCFEMMMDLFAMDYLKLSTPTPERFAVVYNLYSLTKKHRVRVKAFLHEANPEIDSIHDIYKMANWFEREAWDLFGVVFRGHPNLVRILCHGEFVGHPLRKDYPADRYQQLKVAVPSSRL